MFINNKEPKFPCVKCDGKGGFFPEQPICRICEGKKVIPLQIYDTLPSLGHLDIHNIFYKFMENFSHSLYGREGCIFLAYNLETGEFLYEKLGKLSPEKTAEKLFFATEKMQRLATSLEHISSFQSEDIALSRFGGAIRLGKWIFSVSGFPPQTDQQFCIYVAHTHGIIDYSGIIMIVDATQPQISFWNKKMQEEATKK